MSPEIKTRCLALLESPDDASPLLRLIEAITREDDELGERLGRLTLYLKGSEADLPWRSSPDDSSRLADAIVLLGSAARDAISRVATRAGLSAKEVERVFLAIHAEVSRALRPDGSGHFTIPGICKIAVGIEPAKGERELINPATGEKMIARPRPARNRVEGHPLRLLRDMARPGPAIET
jgi:hypothetical protein